MNKKYSHQMLKGALLMLVASSLLTSGCFLFPSSGFHNALLVEGRILSSLDSSFVTGAEVAIHDITMEWTHDIELSDELGEFRCGWSKLTEEGVGPYREWVVCVRDVDGTENGQFADLDTVIIEEEPGLNGKTEWYLDLYVDME